MIRLSKLIMLSNTGGLQLEHVRIARKDFGLPDDFEFSVIQKYPQFFRLFDAKESRSKYVEIVERRRWRERERERQRDHSHIVGVL